MKFNLQTNPFLFAPIMVPNQNMEKLEEYKNQSDDKQY